MTDKLDDDRGPVLYKCPYCVKGRFWDWAVAVQHIKENHTRGTKSTRRRRGRRSNTGNNGDLLATPPSGYNEDEAQESHFMA